MTNKTQILAELEDDIVKQLKAKLALKGLTYKDWLTARVVAYIAEKPLAEKIGCRGSK